MIKVTKDENLDPNDGLYTEPKQKLNKQRGPQTVMLEQPHSRSLPLPRIPLLFFLLFTCHSFNLLVTLFQMPEERKKKKLNTFLLFFFEQEDNSTKKKDHPLFQKSNNLFQAFFFALSFLSFVPTIQPKNQPHPMAAPLFLYLPGLPFSFCPFLVSNFPLSRLEAAKSGGIAGKGRSRQQA